MTQKIIKGIEKAVEYARETGEYYEYYAGSCLNVQIVNTVVEILSSIKFDGFEISYNYGPHSKGFYWSELSIKKVA